MQSDVTELSSERGMNEGLTASFIDPEYDTNQERVHAWDSRRICNGKVQGRPRRCLKVQPRIQLSDRMLIRPLATHVETLCTSGISESSRDSQNYCLFLPVRE